MTDFFKATRPDGTDFYTGQIDYGAALLSGAVVTHPGSAAANGSGSAAEYLSVSTSPADCTGFRWPCRLFRVEPVDPWTPDSSELPNKRACLSLRVVEELPAWQAFGPHGQRVAAVIERARTLSADEATRLSAAWDAARGAAWGAVLGAARGAARDAARDAALGAAWGAVLGAALGAVVRDLITDEHYQSLAGPWESACGPIFTASEPS